MSSFSAQKGLTLVELMIAITLGLFVLLAATTLLLSSKAGYTAQDEASQIQDTGRFVIDNISRAIRQAGLEDWSRPEGALLLAADMAPNIEGVDNVRLLATQPGIELPWSDAVNGSDVLALRFFGTGSGQRGDGVTTDCAGLGVPAPLTQDSADEQRGWSVFYVSEDVDGEPQLMCKFRSGSTWSAHSVARGVESFQVLYGVDSDRDGLPDRFLSAAQIDKLDEALVLNGSNPVARAKDRNRQTLWKRIMVVKISVLIRGAHPARADGSDAEHHLFGAVYSDESGARDPGTRIDESQLPVKVRSRMRKVFSATVQLRNRAAEAAGAWRNRGVVS